LSDSKLVYTDSISSLFGGFGTGFVTF